MTVLVHAHIVTFDEEFHEYPDGAIVFDESGIRFVGATLPQVYASLPEQDLHGALVIPGFCNTHTHLAMVPFRSLADDYRDRLHKFLMPLENAAMDRRLVFVATKMAIAEMLLAGTTSAVDMYYFEDEVVRAAKEMGFRLWAGETILDAPSPDARTWSEGLERTEETIAACQESPLTTPVVAPHAPYSLSIGHLEKIVAFARERGLMWTMHLSEMPFEVEDVRREHGCTPVEWMERHGLLDRDLLAVHLITLSEHDKDVLAGRNVPMSHCPGSNLKAGKGTCPVLDLMDRGVVVTLGTDGASSGNTLDHFTQLKLAAIAQKTMHHDRALMTARECAPLGNRNAGFALRAPIGMLKAGYQADIAVLSLQSPRMHPLYDPYSALCYSATGGDVQDVWVAGVRKVADGELVGIDLPALYAEFDDAAKAFKAEALRRLAE